jgi:hypothetical protein
MGVFALYSQRMRRGSLSHEEIIKAEKAKDDRQRSRAKGFSKMHERDEGMALLSNGARMLWPVPEVWSERSTEGIQTANRERVPEGMFVLKIGNESRLFDAEEFRKCLRWV